MLMKTTNLKRMEMLIRNLCSQRNLRNGFKAGLQVLFFSLISLLAYDVSYAQDANKINVSGIVTNSDGELLPGVNVIIKGTTRGTVTDIDGKYTYQVSTNDVLVFRFIGYQMMEVKVDGRSKINVTLSTDVTDLDEVVVVGYGEVKRANLLGSVSSMSSKEIEDIPVTNLTQLLEGRMAGVSVAPYQPSGNPGAQTRVQIHTETTFGTSNGGRKDASPLYIVDGFTVTQEEWDVMDQSDIESFSVLKDASAAVYGSAGANGVILVKTKRGKEGKITVNYSGSYGFMDATQQTEMLSAYDHARIINTRYQYDPDYAELYQLTPEELDKVKDLNYDWMSLAWQSSYETKHNINVSGGNERVTYFASGVYQYSEGNFPEMGVGKYSYRLGVDTKITDNLKASVTISLDSRDFKRPYMSNVGTNTMEDFFQSLLQAPKWTPPFINGYPVSNNVSTNPLQLFNTKSFRDDVDKGNTLNVKLSYEFPKIKGLVATGTYSRREGHSYSKTYQVPYTTYTFELDGDYNYVIGDQITDINLHTNNDQISESFSYGQRYQLNLNLNYNRKFGLHNIGAFATYEQKENSGYSFSVVASDMQIPNLEIQRAFNYNAAVSNSSLSEGGDLGAVGRINYSYDDKYLLESTLRYETSTLFAPGYRDGFFPSLSMGWVMSQEDFFKDKLSFINFMKLRGSIGLTGFKSVGAYEYVLNYAPSGTYLFGGSSATGGMGVSGQTDVVSTGVTWEKSQMQNIGLDLKFLNQRLSFAIDAFYTYQYDILTQRTVELPEASGIVKMPSENIGKLKAWGYDTEIGYHGRPTKDFSWDVNAIFNFATNRVIESPTKWPENDYRYEIGQSTHAAGREEGYTTNGLVRSQDQLAAINAEWNEQWGHNYYLFGNDMGNVPDEALGFLYYQDIGRAGDVLSGEPSTVFEADGKIDTHDFGYVERTNDHLVAKNFLPTSINMSAKYKEFSFSMLWTMGYGISNQVVDKLARTAPTTKLNAPAFWSDYWSVDNPNAAYPNPLWASDNTLVSTYWMKDVKYLRLRSINLSYNMPKKLSMKIGIPSLRFYVVGTNLWSPIKTFDYKEDVIARFNTYPLLRKFTFGVNIKL